mmetsp:Transcript_11719/g.17400  ORF Transcript_11719/g.17400 Transcript_11719/m.17400 type:complete len:421 (+) Transcript_11719:74-1336(+)
MNDAYDILGVQKKPTTVDYDAKSTFESKMKAIKSMDSEKKKQDKIYHNKVREEAAELVRTPVQKWRFFKFAQDDRDDDLRIYHWRRQEECDDRPYAFSSLNVPIRVFSYNEQEYHTVIAPLEWDAHDRWNKTETDFLFLLCNHFDLMFPIIYDRYNHKAPLFDHLNINEIQGPKTLEQLKRRYYTIAQVLLSYRSFNNTDLIKRHPVMKTPYAFEKETQRMENLKRYFSRLKSIDAEEASIKHSLKHIQSIIDHQAAEAKAAALKKKTPKKRKRKLKKTKDVSQETLRKEAYYEQLALHFDFQESLRHVTKPGVYTRSQLILSTKLKYTYPLRKKNVIMGRLASQFDLPYFGSLLKPCFTEVYQEHVTRLLHQLHFLDTLEEKMVPRAERDVDFFQTKYDRDHPHSPLSNDRPIKKKRLN